MFGDRLRRLLRRRRLFLGCRCDIFRTLERLFGSGGRLLRVDGNFLHAGDDFHGINADLLELQRDFLAVLDLAQDALRRCADALGDGLHVFLNLAHQILNLFGAFLRSFGERAHFVRDHGEALAVFARACGFYRSIQGEQIRLICDAGDGFDDVANAGRLLFQFRDHRDGGGLAFGGHADVADQRPNFGAGLEHERLRRLCLGLAGVGIRELAADRCAHELERGQRFLRGARGLLGAGRNLIRGALQFLRGGRGLVDSRRQFAGCGRNPFGRLLLFGERARFLALGVSLACRGGGVLAGIG